MDPWKPQTECLGSVKDSSSECVRTFDDCFVESKNTQNGSGEQASFVENENTHKACVEQADTVKKLADTDKYLTKLYGRLSRLQQAPSSRQIVSSLQSGREDQLARLLRTDVPASTEQVSVTEPVSTGYLQRRLLPHTVPLSSDELLLLLQEDQLQHQADQQEDQGS